MSGDIRSLFVGVILVAGCFLALVLFTGCTSVSDTNTSGQNNVSQPVPETPPGIHDISWSREALLRVIGPENNVTFKESQETIQGTYHKFSTPDKNIYYINSVTGTIDRVETRMNFTHEVRLSLKDAETAAQGYVNKYSVNQDRAGLVIVNSKLLDHGAFKEYEVEFRETVDGVLVPNLAMVHVNPLDGKLMSYMSIDQDVIVSLKPRVTEEEALKIATGKYPGIKEVSHDCYLAAGNVPIYGQKLVWYVTIIGEPVNNISYGGSAAVDATDGTVLYASGFA